MSFLQVSVTHFAACAHMAKLLSLAVMREIHFLWCKMVHKKET